MKNKDIIWILITLVCAVIVFIIVRRMRNNVIVTEAVNDSNVKAFLKVIRFAEGTSGVNGYRTYFGGGLFSDFSKHPNIKIPFRNTHSTAAGAYQFLYSTWETLRKRLQLPDFSPSSQDLAAVELIREKNALDDVKAGRFSVAVEKVRKIWASFPGAGYEQPEKKLSVLQQKFREYGGTIV